MHNACLHFSVFSSHPYYTHQIICPKIPASKVQNTNKTKNGRKTIHVGGVDKSVLFLCQFSFFSSLCFYYTSSIFHWRKRERQERLVDFVNRKLSDFSERHTLVGVLFIYCYSNWTYFSDHEFTLLALRYYSCRTSELPSTCTIVTPKYFFFLLSKISITIKTSIHLKTNRAEQTN